MSDTRERVGAVMVHQDDHAIWLRFIGRNGNEALITLDSIAGGDEGIIKKALVEWAEKVMSQAPIHG